MLLQKVEACDYVRAYWAFVTGWRADLQHPGDTKRGSCIALVLSLELTSASRILDFSEFGPRRHAAANSRVTS